MKLIEKEIKEICGLEISKRAQNILIRNSISKKTLLLMSIDEIKKIKGVGTSIMNEIIHLFKKNNIIDELFMDEKELLSEFRKMINKGLYQYINNSNKEISSFIKNAIRAKIATTSRVKLIRLKYELFEK